MEATDGSTGGSDVDDDFEDDDEANEGDDDGEEGYEGDFLSGVLDVDEVVGRTTMIVARHTLHNFHPVR